MQTTLEGRHVATGASSVGMPNFEEQAHCECASDGLTVNDWEWIERAFDKTNRTHRQRVVDMFMHKIPYNVCFVHAVFL